MHADTRRQAILDQLRDAAGPISAAALAAKFSVSRQIIVGDIALVLAGAFPLVWAITKVFRKPLMKLGGLLGMNDTAAAGLIASLANSIAMFGMVKDMDQRGKVINVAFAVSAAFVFGDHLGFTAGFDPEMLVPVILGKLAGGVTAIFVAMAITGGKRHDEIRA